MQPLCRGQVQGLRSTSAAGLSHQRPYQLRLDDPFGQRDGCLHEILQLSHIARIVVTHDLGQALCRESRQLDLLALAKAFGEVAHQVRNVLAALSQGRKLDLHPFQAGSPPGSWPGTASRSR